MNHQAAFSKFVCERNIERYERMLHTPLTNLERDFIQRRVAEKRQALAQLVTKNDANNHAEANRSVFGSRSSRLFHVNLRPRSAGRYGLAA